MALASTHRIEAVMKDVKNRDKLGLHELRILEKKLKDLLAQFDSAPPVVGSEDERERRDHVRRMCLEALIDLTKNEATQYLITGNYERAAPIALESLKYATTVYGNGHIKLVPSQLILAETTLGLGKHKQAEEFLSMANWTILKHPDCSNNLKAQLHRNFGKMFAAQGKNQKALSELATGVYFSSLEIGPEHVNTATGYYHMASLFYTMGKIGQALSFYDKVVDTWYKHLSSVRVSGESELGVSEAEVAEAVMMLESIRDTRSRYLGREHLATGEAEYTLGLLYLLIGRKTDSRRAMKSAVAVFSQHLGSDHPSTADAEAVLDSLGAPDEDDEDDDFSATGGSHDDHGPSESRGHAGSEGVPSEVEETPAPSPQPSAELDAGEEVAGGAEEAAAQQGGSMEGNDGTPEADAQASAEGTEGAGAGGSAEGVTSAAEGTEQGSGEEAEAVDAGESVAGGNQDSQPQDEGAQEEKGGEEEATSGSAAAGEEAEEPPAAEEGRETSEGTAQEGAGEGEASGDQPTEGVQPQPAE